MRVGVLAVVVALLAGCAESPGPTGEGDDFSEELDEDLQATATTGVIRGVVVDKAVVPVSDVTVTIQGSGQATVTNAQGAFGFKDLEPGTYFLAASKVGFNGTQTSVEVVAGVDRPDIVKMLVVAVPGLQPYVEALQFNGFLLCGAAIGYTSVGCTTLPAIADATSSASIFPVDFETLPMWSQAELIWENTQPLAGAFIWEQTLQGSNTNLDYRESTGSPALTYVSTPVLEERHEDILDQGINFRFFGGPHELCPATGYPNSFGCGVTADQSAEVFAHIFYNFAPEEGWRFTADGAPQIPS